MRRELGGQRWVVAIAVAACALSPAGAAASVSQRSVTFEVINTNTSRVPCASDRARYRVHGHLISRTSRRRQPGAVTLYLHGLGHGEWFWHFTAVGGYDYAVAQARAGHASVVIDRLGYDTSGHPPGTASCVGSQADVAHQIVNALRTGRYTVSRGTAPRFSRVALAGHSLGGLIAEVEASSYHDVDALLVVAFNDLGSSLTAVRTFGDTALVCLHGGEPAEGPGTAGGYAYFGQTVADFNAVMFFDADPAVVADADALRNRDPCGDTSSVPAGLAVNAIALRSISVPVLLMLGSNDALFPASMGALQKLEFGGSRDVTQVVAADTGHAVTLGRSAPAVRATLGSWLGSHGF